MTGKGEGAVPGEGCRSCQQAGEGCPVRILAEGGGREEGCPARHLDEGKL